MPVAEREEQRTIRELQMMFKEGYDDKVNAENRIYECDKSIKTIKSNNFSALSYASKFTSPDVTKKINLIEESAQQPQTLDDPMLIDLKQSLIPLFEQCDQVNIHNFTAFKPDQISYHPKKTLLNNSTFKLLSEKEKRISNDFIKASHSIKETHLERAILAQEIESEKERILNRRYIIGCVSIITFIVSSYFILLLIDKNPQLIKDIMKSLISVVNK